MKRRRRRKGPEEQWSSLKRLVPVHASAEQWQQQQQQQSSSSSSSSSSSTGDVKGAHSATVTPRCGLSSSMMRLSGMSRRAVAVTCKKGHHDLCRGHPGSSRTSSSAAGDRRRRQTAESLAWAPECPPAPVFLNTIQVARMSLTFCFLCVVVLVRMPIKTATR